MSDYIKWIQSAADYLQVAPAWFMVVAASIVIGYILKLWKLFPNQLIPVCVVPAAIAIEIALMWPARQQPLGSWFVRQGIVGMVLGFAAWVLHRAILHRFEDKFPWLKQAVQDSGFDSTPPFKPGQSPGTPVPDAVKPTETKQ